MTHIQELRDVIHHLHGATASHLESVPVTERFQGKTIWEGIVEVFHLEGHPRADRVYAWVHATDDPAKPRRHVTVLHIPPVVSPQAAVKASIVQDFKEHGKAN
jgi:hypothetical protein